jgi:hypothetical protein
MTEFVDLANTSLEGIRLKNSQLAATRLAMPFETL